MLELHFNGMVYELDADQSMADVFQLMNEYTKNQNGKTWLKLADGRTVHVQVDGQPTFAVVAPKGYRGEGLKVARHYRESADAGEPFDPSKV